MWLSFCLVKIGWTHAHLEYQNDTGTVFSLTRPFIFHAAPVKAADYTFTF